tara:strand:+ start:1520 stop:1663 length:144 start_codon:yes stop_codon:yes gene_type:complete
MSQKIQNEIHALKEQVRALQEEMALLRAVVATKRRTKDMKEPRHEAN